MQKKTPPPFSDRLMQWKPNKITPLPNPLTLLPAPTRRRTPDTNLLIRILRIAHQSLELKLLCILYPAQMPDPISISHNNPILPIVLFRREDAFAGEKGRRGRGEWPRGVGVESEQHADEKEEEEGEGVEQEDVGDVCDVGGGQEGHLFFRGAHEEEARGVEEL